jgi:hypothetical protein
VVAVGESQVVEARITALPSPEYGNPLPLGLLGYGMTTVVLSLANAGVYELGTMVLAMAVFFGGTAQTIVAILSFRRKDSFAVTAFGGYSFLWLTFAFLLLGQQNRWWPTANSATAMGWYLFLWAIFTFGLLIASLLAPRVLSLVLALTFILLLLLAVSDWTGSATLGKIGGWEGIVTGASAIYLAFAFLLNEVYNRTVLPVGNPLALPSGA